MAVSVKQNSFNIPGPRPAPVAGRILSSIRFAEDSVGYSSKLFKKYGPIVALSQKGGTRLYSPRTVCPGTVLAYGPELVREATTQHDIYYKYPLSGPLYRLKDRSERTKPLKNFLVGLFGVNEEEHLRQRKLMMPAFHRQQLTTYTQDMTAVTEQELDRLETLKTCDIAAWTRQVTLRIATKTLFGEDIGTEGGSIGQIIKAATNLQRTRLMAFLPYDLPGLPLHRYLNLAARYEAIMRDLIERKRLSSGQDPDILSMLTQVQDEESKAPLSENELIGHIGVIFVAGHETSANALTWTLFLLSQHPSILADLLDELDDILKGSPPTLEQIQKLSLLENVIKESMRILPPVPWNGRVTAKPTELGGQFLPEGTEVFMSIYQTHHMPELYTSPESFQPRRWETITPNNFEYNPFSAGPRICIGAGFAMMEIKIILAMLLQRFRLQFLPQNPVERTGVIVMSPKFGLPMGVYKQDRQFQQGVGGVKGNVLEMVNLS